MSHHLSKTAIESAADRTVVVEQAPLDSPRQAAVAASSAGTGSAAAAPVSAPSPAAAAAAAPASSSAGASGMSGANVPVESVQAASTGIRDAQTDLASTASAPRRLDGLDGVGGGGGGGGDNAGDVQETGDGAVAAGTANQDVSQTGLGNQTTDTQTSPEAIDINKAKDGGGANTGVAADSNGNPSVATTGATTQEA